MSAPLPTLDFHAERFSQFLQCHAWLQTAGISHCFYFIEKFNSLLNPPPFDHRDGLPPPQTFHTFYERHLAQVRDCLRVTAQAAMPLQTALSYGPHA